MILGGFIDTGSCLSWRDLEIERRPYHRNCSCALHNLKGVCAYNTCSQRNDISFPYKKQAWNSDRSLSISSSTSKFSSRRSSLIVHKTLLQ
ncbi:hypothetical protein Patl1_14825 [Pistacia atlantica]|uniref:Uncharacterized protein n=1 Tax=Pistacia atlantica TaxID=434234 RepID=A0ACC1ATQ8_9ROSI|nr:hypothetical protein Patl1_14825 [Pistacia atlantica]